MRWWRDKTHARFRETQLRDHLVNLVARQLPAFAGLGALRDLDLDDLGIDEILGGDAEAAGRNLLDLRHALVAVTRGILAAFTRVRAATHAVHRDRERLMGLGRQRAERHAGTVEARQNFLDRLHLVKRHGFAGRLDVHQVAQCCDRPFVNQPRIFSITFKVTGLYRGLQGCDDVRVIAMIFTVVHILVQTALLDQFTRFPCHLRELSLVIEQVVEVRSLDARCRALEAALHNLVVQTDDLEQLRTAVTRDGRDTHLRHDLEQALANTAPVGSTQLLLPVDVAALRDVMQRLVDEIGIHHRRAITDKARNVMRIAGNACLHNNVGVTAQARVHEVVMHSARCEQRMDGQLAFHEVTVAEHDDQVAVAHSLLGLRTNLVQRLGQAQVFIDVQVDEDMAVFKHAGTKQLA